MTRAIPSVSSSAPRWLAIDQTRGAAMVLVWLSHFSVTYFRSAPLSLPARFLGATTKVASPTFVALSGMLLGWLTVREGERAETVRLHFTDRALFLLTVAHVVIWSAHIAIAGGLRAALRVEFMTDTIAVCMLAGPIVILALGRAARLLTSAALFAACWALLWLGDGNAPGGILGEVIVGSLRPLAMDYAFPILPWMSFFIVATVLGETLRELRPRGLVAVARAAWRSSVALLATALVLSVVHGEVASRQSVIWALTAVSQKAPPGLMYLAIYGGVSMSLFATFVEIEHRHREWALGRLLALIGRNSLFAFIAQYFVYYTGIMLLHPKPSAWWGGWLAATIAMLVGATMTWNAVDGNRWLTVGLRARRQESSLHGEAVVARRSPHDE